MSLSVQRPILIRALPFFLFLAFILVRDMAESLGSNAFDIRLIYPIKAMLVAALLAYFWREYGELRQGPAPRTWMWLWAPVIGIAVFVLWINLDQGWLNVGGGGFVYDPRDSQNGEIIWPLAVMRLMGAALVVPVMEELFWRSFLMRWIDSHDFLALAPVAVSLKAVLISSLIFGLEHSLWLAGILAGLAYAWLYRASGSLWPPIIAHGTTNGLLGLWVLHTGNWQFW